MKEFRIEELRAKDIMEKNPITTTPEENLSTILGKMKENDIHELPVLKKKKVVGLISFDTLIKRRNLPLSTKVENIMIVPPEISANDALTKIAEALMSSGYRAVPIISKGKLAGIVSRSDLIHIIPEIEDLGSIGVEEIMTPSPKCISQNDTIVNARNLMVELDERTIPVVDDDEKLAGVIGLKDLADLLWRPKIRVEKSEGAGESRPVSVTIKSIMRTPPISVGLDACVKDVVNLMAKYNISSIMVTEEREPIGIITQIDLIELIAAFREEEEVYVQITGLEEDDPEVYDAMYELIQKFIKRTAKIVVPKILAIHVVHYHPGGEVSKYSIRVRMFSERKMFYAKAFDWNLLRALDETLDQLEKNIKKEKDRRLMYRRTRVGS